MNVGGIEDRHWVGAVDDSAYLRIIFHGYWEIKRRVGYETDLEAEARTGTETASKRIS